MIPEFGLYALILALGLASLQAILPLYGSWRGDRPWLMMARPLAYGQCFFVSIAFLCLAYAFLSNDFSVAYVTAHSNTALPVIYRFCAIWGAHEGSMLLWVLTLNLWTVAVAFCSQNLPLVTVARVLSVLGMVSVAFLSFILATSNPFLRLLPLAPTNGRDLNPILQDPGLVSHPPMLYMGYVGFSVAFAFAIAALLGGRFDKAWIRWTRPWTLAAWCFLTIGITMGSWWSYHQLGWGGWWFWDPVENASFLPWLTGTALLHSLAVAEKRDGFKGWTLLLAIAAFSLSLLGTFLVRSGILVSVHAFAVDPSRGFYMLLILAVVVGSSLLLYAVRAGRLRQAIPFRGLSRESAILANNVILMVMMATILLGTLYPLVLQVFDIAKISVGMPYFNAVFVPLILPMMLLMGFGPHCAWQATSGLQLWQQLRRFLGLAVSLGVILPWWLGGTFYWSVALCMSVTFWLFLSSGYGLWRVLRLRHGGLPASQIGMWIAHLGIAVCAVGIILSQAYSDQRDVLMQAGDSLRLGPYQVLFTGVAPLLGPNYQGQVGYFVVRHGKLRVTRLAAQKRVYTAAGNIIKTQAAIYPAFVHEVYVVMGQKTAADAWQVRAYYKPFVRWIWAGGFLLLFGGVWAMLDRRYRQVKRTSVASSMLEGS